MTKSPEKLCAERLKRVNDAIQLKVPDRVPMVAFNGFFAAKYCGYTFKDAMYDREKTAESTLRYINDFQPDLGDNPFTLVFLGKMMESIGYKNLLWAGHGLHDMATYQFLEKEVMKREEYDEFLFDPTGFIVRKIWPRIYEPLKAFENLPVMNDMCDFVANAFKFAAFGGPEMRQALEALNKAGDAIQEVIDAAVAFEQQLKDLGFPTLMGGLTQAPFDYTSDFLRGTKGAFLDMLQIPDKVLAMVDKVYPIMLNMGLGAKATGNPGVFMPLHKCLDNFMSPAQFEKFYWPSLRKLIIAQIDEGLIPMVLWEGNCETRLETIADIPPGKAIYIMEDTDMIKAKEVLGDVVCLQGGVPLTLLCTGTPDDVTEHCKKMIKHVGKNGGYIMQPSTMLDDAKVENVKAMFDANKKYGVYQ